MNPKLMQKYTPFPRVNLPDRTWPDKAITKAPAWCSVDLRDGNQALIIPMNISQKLKMFKLLVEMGFKEIEVGFPSASETEYRFLRKLIEEDLIPADVSIQVLTQAREHLIRKTVESLKGCKRAIIHLYNSTSTLQRKVVFQMGEDEIKNLAVNGTKLVKSLTADIETDITFQYSPESFSGTEIDYAVEVCEAVMNVWQPTTERRMILNLPATVELSLPIHYADQIESFCRRLQGRERAIISIHTHNDRGTAVAASELALLAGGDRIEGTLFGNGERTGNVDILTVALNMYTQGVDPGLDLHNINRIIEVSEECTRIPVHIRHPYAGQLVYTAFSGSHQDAINKGMSYQAKHQGAWSVPYLPVDPTDLGRTYESIIRINSQSGKGGVAYIMETEFGYTLPKAMHPEFGAIVQSLADQTGDEILPEEIFKAFQREYIRRTNPFEFLDCKSFPDKGSEIQCDVRFRYNGQEMAAQGKGNGPIDACRSALLSTGLVNFSIVSYSEHSLEEGSGAIAVAYIQIKTDKNEVLFGAGIDSNIDIASIRALFSAINRASA